CDYFASALSLCELLVGILLCRRLLCRSLLRWCADGRDLLRRCLLRSRRALLGRGLLCSRLFRGRFLCSCHFFLLDQVEKSTSGNTLRPLVNAKRSMALDIKLQRHEHRQPPRRTLGCEFS